MWYIIDKYEDLYSVSKFVIYSSRHGRFQKSNKIEIVIGIKGGIDPAGDLEWHGADLKSLGKVRKTHSNAKTILLLENISLIPKVCKCISEESIIDLHCTLDSLFDSINRQKFFMIWKFDIRLNLTDIHICFLCGDNFRTVKIDFIRKIIWVTAWKWNSQLLLN